MKTCSRLCPLEKSLRRALEGKKDSPTLQKARRSVPTERVAGTSLKVGRGSPKPPMAVKPTLQIFDRHFIFSFRSVALKIFSVLPRHPPRECSSGLRTSGSASSPLSPSSHSLFSSFLLLTFA
jgi:hypothetical protein